MLTVYARVIVNAEVIQCLGSSRQMPNATLLDLSNDAIPVAVRRLKDLVRQKSFVGSVFKRLRSSANNANLPQNYIGRDADASSSICVNRLAEESSLSGMRVEMSNLKEGRIKGKDAFLDVNSNGTWVEESFWSWTPRRALSITLLAVPNNVMKQARIEVEEEGDEEPQQRAQRPPLIAKDHWLRVRVLRPLLGETLSSDVLCDVSVIAALISAGITGGALGLFVLLRYKKRGTNKAS